MWIEIATANQHNSQVTRARITKKLRAFSVSHTVRVWWGREEESFHIKRYRFFEILKHYETAAIDIFSLSEWIYHERAWEAKVRESGTSVSDPPSRSQQSHLDRRPSVASEPDNSGDPGQ